MNRIRYTSDEDKALLREVTEAVLAKTMSLRGGAKFLFENTGKNISHEGLRKIINNLKEPENVGGEDSPELGIEPARLPDE